jgi:uncharacterized protein (TIGR03067 family)
MRSITIFSALALFVAASAARAQEPPADVQAELKKLQGLWQDHLGGATHKDGGESVMQPVLDGPCFFIDGNRIIWLDENGKPSGREDRITLDLKANPKQITRTAILIDGKEVAAAPRQGIYELTESGLRVQFGLDGGPAPKQFLEVNKPIKGVDGSEWMISRKKISGK